MSLLSLETRQVGNRAESAAGYWELDSFVNLNKKITLERPQIDHFHVKVTHKIFNISQVPSDGFRLQRKILCSVEEISGTILIAKGTIRFIVVSYL